MAFFRRTSVLLLAAGAAWICSPSLAGAQKSVEQATVRTAENFREEPNGQILARLSAGTPVSVVGRKERWLEVVVDGWVWSRSLRAVERSDFDLAVSAAGGENLRRKPGGAILGHLANGTLLGKVEEKPGWIHVRRRGWLWAASVAQPAQHPVVGGVGPTATGGHAPAKSSGATSPGPAATRPRSVAAVGAGGAPILAAPGGDTVARASPGTELEVVSRQGGWARVRVEGWTWLPKHDSTGASEDSIRILTPAELAQAPEAYRGRLVSWKLQFISLEHAEKVRTDFFEGEPFLLTRYGGPDGPFVYVAIPDSRVDEMRGLIPLERIEVTGRVRTGASSLTGTPIIDLVSLKRAGKSP